MLSQHSHHPTTDPFTGFYGIVLWQVISVAMEMSVAMEIFINCVVYVSMVTEYQNYGNKN